MITGKLSFAVVGGPASITLPATTIAGLHDQFGVLPGVTNALPFRGPNVVSFSSQTVLQIRSDLVSNGDNILEQLYAPEFADFSSVVAVQTDLALRSKPLVSASNTSPRFYLCDEDPQPVDLNGHGMVLTIMIFRPIDYLIREYIVMKSAEVSTGSLDKIAAGVTKMARAVAAPKPKTSRPSRPIEPVDAQLAKLGRPSRSRRPPIK